MLAFGEVLLASRYSQASAEQHAQMLRDGNAAAGLLIEVRRVEHPEKLCPDPTWDVVLITSMAKRETR